MYRVNLQSNKIYSKNLEKKMNQKKSVPSYLRDGFFISLHAKNSEYANAINYFSFSHSLSNSCVEE